MVRPLMIGFLCVFLGACQPSPQPQPTLIPPDLVSASVLVRSYRDWSAEQADKTWTGRRIQVVMTTEQYQVFENQVQWFSGLPKAPPVLIFLCTVPVRDNQKTITLVGTCKGKIIDGKKRGDGISWYIVIDECSVTVL